jgi:hypothetical protein
MKTKDPIEKIIEEVFYEFESWYLDEGDYQPTQEEATEKIRQSLKKYGEEMYLVGQNDVKLEAYNAGIQESREQIKGEIIRGIDEYKCDGCNADCACYELGDYIKELIKNI